MGDKKNNKCNVNKKDRHDVKKYTINNMFYLFTIIYILLVGIFAIFKNNRDILKIDINKMINIQNIVFEVILGIFLLIMFSLLLNKKKFINDVENYENDEKNEKIKENENKKNTNNFFKNIKNKININMIIIYAVIVISTILTILKKADLKIINEILMAYIIFRTFFRRSNKRLKKVYISIALFALSLKLLGIYADLSSIHVMAIIFAIDLLDNKDFKYISIATIMLYIVSELFLNSAISPIHFLLSIVLTVIYFLIIKILKKRDFSYGKSLYTNKEKKAGRVVDKTLDRYNANEYTKGKLIEINIKNNIVPSILIALNSILVIYILIKGNILTIDKQIKYIVEISKISSLTEYTNIFSLINIALIIIMSIIGIRKRNKIDKRYLAYIFLLIYSLITNLKGFNLINITIIYTMSLTALDRLIHNRDYDIDPVAYKKKNDITDFDRLLNDDPINKTKLTTKARVRKHRKVVFAITSLTIGGAERVLVDIAKEMQDIYDITIYTIYGNGTLEKELIGSNVSLKSLFKKEQSEYGKFRQKFNILFFNLFKNIIYTIQIKDIYDVEIAFLEGPVTRMFANPSFAKKIAWLHSDISNFYETNNYRTIKIIQDNINYSKYDDIIFVSNELKESFEKFFPDNTSKKQVIYNYIDENRIKQKAQSYVAYEITEEEKSLVTVARLVEQKALFRFLNVHKRLLDDGILHRVYIVGDGPLKDELTKKAREMGLKATFRILGSRINPYPYIKKGDYFCLLSYSEGYGIVLDEAKILGKPIILTDSAAREAAQNYSNSYILDNNEEAIYKGLKKILTQGKIKKKKKKSEISYSVLNSNKIYSIIRLIDN